MGEQISKLKEKLSHMPTNQSMLHTIDGAYSKTDAISKMLSQKRSMSTIKGKEVKDPFLNKRSTMPSIFHNDFTEKD